MAQPRRQPHESTLTERPPSQHVGDLADGASAPALVLVWSEGEPGRVGQVLVLPLAVRVPVSIGRALDPGEDGALPLVFRRLRPHAAETTGPFGAARISRYQVRLLLGADESLHVEHTGRGALQVQGAPAQRATLRHGDVLWVVGRFMLLYSRRPVDWPRGDRFGAPFPFGAADGSGLVGESVAAWNLRRQVAFLAARGEHALVYGPSGSGKELVVRAIHAASSRGNLPLVARNAATIPESLIDAELFGNLKNYPNPGMADRVGLLGEADGSTLFLDEIGELSHTLQAHLLRVMDSGEYQRLGEAARRTTRARLIAATNRDPAVLKHDLLARFAHRLRVPGLGERPEDVPLIARHQLRQFAAEDPGLRRFFVGEEPRLSPQLAHALVRHAFTTHTRELSEILWRSIAGRRGATIELPPDFEPSAAPAPRESAESIDPKGLSREQIVAALTRHNGVRGLGRRELGLRSRDQLKRLLKKYDIA